MFCLQNGSSIHLYLMDPFFSLPLTPTSQPMCAFEWTSSEDGFNEQLTWTRLLQVLKNSPTIFDEAFHMDLGEYWQAHLKVSLLQFVNDFLIADDTLKSCKAASKGLLRTLGDLYCISAKKAADGKDELDPKRDLYQINPWEWRWLDVSPLLCYLQGLQFSLYPRPDPI